MNWLIKLGTYLAVKGLGQNRGEADIKKIQPLLTAISPIVTPILTKQVGKLVGTIGTDATQIISEHPGIAGPTGQIASTIILSQVSQKTGNLAPVIDSVLSGLIKPVPDAK